MKAVGHHLASLDAFRGLTIAAMILVNNPGNWGAVFDPLLHSAWNGCSFADIVFPFFLFIMGLAMPFAFARRRQRGVDGWRQFRRVCRRTLSLIALGLVLNAVAAAPHVVQMRIPGVLQRIALSYFVAAIVVLRLGAVGQAVTAGALLAAHWALLTLVPFGGHAAGTVSATASLAGYIDARVFGTHLLNPANDPEGLLGTLSSAATVLVGALAGQWMRAAPDDRRRLAGLIAGGAAMMGLGAVWALVLPVNKPLWTGSYALVTSGLAALCFAGSYFVIDVKHRTRWVQPLIWLGVNPLAIYFLAEFTGHVIERPWVPVAGGYAAVKELVYWRLFAPLDGNAGGAWLSLAFAACFVAASIALAGLFARRGVRIQV